MSVPSRNRSSAISTSSRSTPASTATSPSRPNATMATRMRKSSWWRPIRSRAARSGWLLVTALSAALGAKRVLREHPPLLMATRWTGLPHVLAGASAVRVAFRRGRQKGKARGLARGRWRMPAPLVQSRHASCYRDEAGVDAPPATWSALPAQRTTGAWIATGSLLLRASGWRPAAANDDGSWLRFAGQLGQRPTRARLAIAETRGRALRQWRHPRPFESRRGQVHERR